MGLVYYFHLAYLFHLSLSLQTRYEEFQALAIFLPGIAQTVDEVKGAPKRISRGHAS